MRNRLMDRVFSLMLAVVMLLSSLHPTIVWASTGEINPAESMDASMLDGDIEPYIEPKDEAQLQTELEIMAQEVCELREENVKHIRLPDGTYQAIVYGGPVHRINDAGEWIEINNSLKDMGAELATGDERIKFTKKITGNGNIFTLHEKNYKVTVGLEGAIKKTIGVFVNNSKVEETESNLQEIIQVENLTANVLYEDILDGVDIEYEIVANDVKENIIVKDRDNEYCYTFSIMLNGLCAEQVGNTISLFDNKSGEIVYQIPEPYMYDADGQSSTAVTYTLEEDGNGKYLFVVTADAEWINAEEREFPIVIDPTLLNLGQSADTYVLAGSPSTNYGSSKDMWVLDTGYTYLTFAKPTLPADAEITAATLRVPFYYNVENQKYLTLGAYQITSGWSEKGTTWNNKPSTGSTALDTCDAYANGASETAPDYVSFIVSEYVKTWYTGSTNYGFALKREGGTNTSILIPSREKMVAYAQMSIYYSGKDLADGVYAIQRGGTYTYMKAIKTGAVTSVVQDTTHSSAPTSSADLENLFKIAYRPQYDDYVIRSMLDSSLVMYASGDANKPVTYGNLSTDANISTYYTWDITPTGSYYYISKTRDGVTYYVRSVSTTNGASLTLTTNASDTGTKWSFSAYTGNVIEKVKPYRFDYSLTVGDKYSYIAYMYSTRINHNGPVTYSVLDTDGTSTDKATINSKTGYLTALKAGQIRLVVTYPGAPWVWYWVITIQSAGCKPYNAITSSTDSEYTAMNCHGYALWSTASLATFLWMNTTAEELSSCSDSNDYLELVKTDFEENWLDTYIGSSNWEDVTNTGGINVTLADNQWLVVMRVGYHEDCVQPYDYHFWYRTDTGEWVNKHGYNSFSEKLGSDLPTNNDSVGWSLGDYENYYDSDLIYYRITE